MALKSMKVTKEDRKKREEMYNKPCIDADDYPYELRLHLNAETLSKLGLSKLPKTGATVKLTAEARVVSTEVSERNGKDDKRMGLQIEKLEVTV